MEITLSIKPYHSFDNIVLSKWIFYEAQTKEMYNRSFYKHPTLAFHVYNFINGILLDKMASLHIGIYSNI